MFLISNIVFTASALAVYWGDPWKLRFYQHIPLLVIFLLDMIAGTAFFFTTEHIAGAFGFKAIGVETGAVLFGITMGGVLLQLAYNGIIRSCDFYKTKI